MTTRTFNLADLFEIVAGAVPDRTALVAGDVRLTYAELDERTDRLAHHLLTSGIRPGDFVGVYAWNRAEWAESMIGIHKARAIPVNINYRYVEAELRYLFGNCGMAGLIVERAFAPMVEALRSQLPHLRHVLVLEDGTDAAGNTITGAVGYEEALASATPGRDAVIALSGERTPDDRYGLYTGGTTGMPKCVLWRGEDIYFAALAAGRAGRPPITTPEQLGEEIVAAGGNGVTMLGLAPLMHGGGQWAMWNAMYLGSTYVMWTGRHFDADKVLELASRERAVSVSIVGDGMGRPLADWFEKNTGKYDLSGLMAFSNGGAPLSAAVRLQLEKAAGVIVVDGFGASETGAAARQVGVKEGATRFSSSATTTVLDDNLDPIEPGSGVVGMLAVSGHIPLGYHGDDEKTRATFKTDRNGRRWVIPGDYATIEADGTLTLLGRGSATINTGGEKVFPDEVESALKSHPDVFDAVVVGVPDERFGQRVTALVVPRPGANPALEELGKHCRTLIAGYKVPKQIHIVDAIERTAAGKVDLRAAKARAEELSAS